MIQRFHRPVATWLSTNHPVLWVARADVAVLLAVILALLGIAIAWAGALAKQMIFRLANQMPDLVPPEGAVVLLNTFHTVLTIVVAGLGAIAAVIWFATVTKSIYKAVAPRMRMYPRVIDLFAALLLIGGVTATAILLLDWAVGIDPDQTGFWPDATTTATKYLAYAIEPAVVLATIFAIILRWSLGVALALTTVAAIIALFVLWIAVSIESVVPGASAAKRDTLTTSFMASVSIIWVLGAFWVAQSRRSSRAKNLFVALSVPMLILAVGGIEGCVIVLLDHLARLGHVAFSSSTTYAAQLFFAVHAAITVLLVHWLCIRWAKLSMRPG